ncbi:MAG: winged helix-turn-helix domain-containing protein [Veillonella parvula]
MNVVEYDIVNEIIRHPYINQRELAERVGYSVGKVNSSLNTLCRNQYLNKDYSLTEKALREIKEKNQKCNYSCGWLWYAYGSNKRRNAKRAFRNTWGTID